MKVSRIALFVAGGLLVPAALADFNGGVADVTRLGAGGGRYFFGDGGEFTVYNNTKLSNDAYAAVTKDQGGTTKSFQTFCMEIGEHVTSPVDIVVSTTNAQGGPDGSGSHAVLGGAYSNPGVGDDLDARTAYLYTQFALGTLGGYNYVPVASGRRFSAGSLQLAIWYIEEEIDLATLSADAQAVTWYNEAVEATEIGSLVGGGVTDGSATWKGIGKVRVLNMTSGGDLKQDMLWLATPAPGAALLIGVGLAAIGWFRRKIS